MNESAGSRPRQIDRLHQALQEPLPGTEAHREAWPEHLPTRRLAEASTKLREAAILIALYFDPLRIRWVFPMVQRTSHMRHHARQIGFPGGARRRGESPETCALRESQEEIGLNPRGVDVLGRLSRVEIPVSNFVVEPVVGWLREAPQQWTLQQGEVKSLLLADVETLVLRGLEARYVRERDGTRFEVPAFDVEGHKVWGASALMIAELRRLWPLDA